MRGAARFLPLILCLAGMPAAAAGRNEAPNLPPIPYRYAWPQLPAHLADGDRLIAPGPAITDAGATLGRVLFYDRKLSANGLVGCASCHSQSASFDDPNRFSIGLRGKITRRSAMALANARINPTGRYFRDQRAASLEDQVLTPFTDPVEMDLPPGELVRLVSGRSWYGPLFADAFGDPTASEARIASALAQFVSAMVSVDTRYDNARTSTPDVLAPFSAFDAAENRGKFLFFAAPEIGGAGCANCHETEWFVFTQPHDNGLPMDAARQGASADGGAGEITGDSSQMRLFRAPSLRNVAVASPYMHDGRFNTLEAVVDHYSGGVTATANLDPALKKPDGSPQRLSLSADDRRALVAFLETLTDANFLEDPKFSDPFRID